MNSNEFPNDMSSMFDSCMNLEKIDLNKFDRSKVINMNSMFYFCQELVNRFK